ncbi:MAG: helix-turn-helix transcriptional regulator [Ignavibacteriaceae bacterium]|nr:helix-turn-helix transcriptional regulator [Ignavibacteriaceae bacterium]
MKNTKNKSRIILSNNMRKFRTLLGITQEELSYRSGLHRTYISSVERTERNISVDAIEKIAKAFNISISKLLEE